MTQYHMVANKEIFSHFDYMRCDHFAADSIHQTVHPVCGRVTSSVAKPVYSQVQLLLYAECTWLM